MNGKHLAFVLVCLLLSFNAYLQVEGQFIEAGLDYKCPFTITSYTSKQGLPQSQVIAIRPKRNGSLIITTANGIVEYDGHDFEEFIPNAKYKAHMCREVLWDDRTQQLFITRFLGGLYRFFPDYRELLDCRTATIANRKIYALDARGNLYVSAVDHIAFKRIADTRIREVISVMVDGSTAYVGSIHGTFTIDLANGNAVNKIGGDTLQHFTYDPFSSAYCAVSPGAVYRIEGNAMTRLFSIAHTANWQITDVEFVGPGRFYVATSKGLYAVGRGYTRFYGKEYLHSDFFISLHYNRQEDCLFVGTGENGLLRLQHKDCYPYRTDMDLAGLSMSSIVRTANNELFAAGSPGVIYRLGTDRAELYWEEPGSFACLGIVGSLAVVGTWGEGAYVLKNGKRIHRISEPHLPDERVHAVFKDSRGGIWIGTDKGIARGRSLYNMHPALSWKVKGVIICFYELRNGTVCIGSNQGAYLVDPHGKVVVISAGSGLGGKEVRSFYEDKEGKLWIGTYNGGLYCYHKGKLTSINQKKNCLLHSDVFTLAKDRFGYLNITSNHGLWRILEKDLNDFYYNRIDRIIPFSLGQEAGIVNTEFNGGFQNNYAQTPDGLFYFPTIKGVVIFRPKAMERHRLRPRLRRIWVNDTIYAGKPVFSRATHTLQFDFSCAQFTSKYNPHYQYKVVGQGFPDEWSRLQKESSVSFKLLPPGRYTLVIRTVDAFNDRRPEELRYTFRIEHYVYETTWFRILALAVILAAVIAWARMRILFVSRRERHISTINNTILELKLKAIQAKMNPHFIFNALNNIQYLIVLKELDLAEHALTDFSQLLRKFLQQSDQSFVRVEDEFEMLELYLSIEKLRFNGQLSYTFEAGPELRQLFIPSMLLQPLVENAIKHGLLHSENERSLYIKAVRSGDLLRIAIEDNGIGRTASMEINKKRPEHISHGLSLVAEKIKIVREKYGLVIHFTVEDIDDDGRTGTRVVFGIPVMTENLSDSKGLL